LCSMHHAMAGVGRCLLIVPVVFRSGFADEASDEQAEAEAPWQTDLVGTHFWDCNGAGCDATLLQPWNPREFIIPSQYAPMDPSTFEKGALYGEKLWVMGAASDDLAERLGPDAPCCGHDKKQQGCGKCLLVRNPSALQSNWTVLVMKKSRCPPETKGCEKGNIHMDFAVPGLDVLSESTANVCGQSTKEDTYITRAQSGVCGDWMMHGNNTTKACNCSLLPDVTPEQQLLRNGCELFIKWGWTSGNPSLEWKQVACPGALEDRVQSAFGPQGVQAPASMMSWFWVGVGCLVLSCCVAVCALQRFFEHRDKKKKKKRRHSKSLNQRSYSSSESTDSSGSEESTQ